MVQKTTLSPELTGALLTRLWAANRDFAARFPGDGTRRQPVHVVYGGAHLFTEKTPRRLGALARASLDSHAPTFVDFARALRLPGHEQLSAHAEAVEALERRIERDATQVKEEQPAAWLAFTVHQRVRRKLEREPVEDYRLDYEDGYGVRGDEEEDGHALQGARAVAEGLAAGSLPPFIGLRIKPLAQETSARAIRTLDLFLTALTEATKGQLPPHFVVTLPKVQNVAQVEALVALFELLEPRLGLPAGALRFELMVELTQTLVSATGEVLLPRLVAAGQGRCVGAHFGSYDYTASCDVTAQHQRMTHPSCDFARHMMQVALCRTGVFLSDGATTAMPVAPHRAQDGQSLTEAQRQENRQVVHAAWRLAFDNITDSLSRGFYQGWDLHPGQLPARYAATYAFFLIAMEPAARRLRAFVDAAAQATRVGDVFDDAATGQGLLNFFLRAIGCGALEEAEVLALTGLSLAQLQGRSFVGLTA